MSEHQINCISKSRIIRPISNGVVYKNNAGEEVFNSEEWDCVLGVLSEAYGDTRKESLNNEEFKVTVIFEKV